MRRTPLTTWYSAVRFLPRVVHWPPAFLTASPRTTGWPPSIAYRARRSAPLWPAHDTRSESRSTAAVRPCVVLYCARLQFRESASSTGVRHGVAVEGSTNAATAAAASPANTTEVFRLILRLQ